MAEVQALVRAARTLGLSLAARGAGLSYSAGYLPGDARTVVVDMTAMNGILGINQEDRFVTVEPGVTWAALHEALSPLGLTTPFWGTFSGRHATVGASLSQGAKFYGSGYRGTSAESVLGLTVVTGAGDVLVTGSAATAQAPSPFFRNYGPDLTGPLLGDCGAFGIKVAATLVLVPSAGAVAMASCSFDDPAALLRAMGRIGAEMLATECLAMDPFTARARLASQGLRADLAALGSVLRGGGVRDAVQIAVSGRRFAKRIGYLMNCIAEGRDRGDADSRIRRVRAIAAAEGGRRVPASVPKVMRGDAIPADERAAHALGQADELAARRTAELPRGGVFRGNRGGVRRPPRGNAPARHRSRLPALRTWSDGRRDRDVDPLVGRALADPHALHDRGRARPSADTRGQPGRA